MCRESRVGAEEEKEGGEGYARLVLICNFMAATICTSSSLALSLPLCLSLPVAGDDLTGESFNQLLTGPRGCQHLWHVQQQQQQHIGTLRMSQIELRLNFSIRPKARGNA